MRTILYTLQSNTAILFRCFLRLSHSRNMDLEHKDLTTEVHIFENVVENVIEMLKATELEGHLPYILVLLNFNTFVFTIPKASLIPLKYYKQYRLIFSIKRGAIYFICTL